MSTDSTLNQFIRCDQPRHHRIPTTLSESRSGGRRKYNSQQLHRLRSKTFRVPPSPELLTILKVHGILRYRGSRGGKAARRRIPVRVGNRTPLSSAQMSNFISNKHRPPPTRHIIPCSQIIQYSRGLTCGHSVLLDSSPPSLYVFNANSIAKPHAIEHLTTELTGYNSDVAIITETHL